MADEPEAGDSIPISNGPNSLSSTPSSGENASSFHATVLDSLHDGVYFVDMERRIIFWNQGATQLTGYTRAEAIGRQCFDNFLNHVDEQGCMLCFGRCPLAATLEDGQRRDAEVYLQHKSGHRIPVSVRIAPVRDSAGRITGAVELFSDISAKKNIERRADEMENLAFRDPLTGVPNRRYIALKVEQALQEVEQFERQIGLLMIDIDNFKHVNDAYGHESGDLVLTAVCNTISHSLRPGDMVGRWGGEEFLLLTTNVGNGGLGMVAERIRKLIAESRLTVGNERMSVTVSLGATLLLPGESAAAAIKRADELMYKSKLWGKNRTTQG